MPLSDDQKALAFATLLPGAATVVGTVAYLNDPSIVDWYKGLKKPAIAIPATAPGRRVKGVLNMVVTGSFVYATHRVWKEGGGPDNPETRCALASCAAFWAGTTVVTPLFFKRCLKLSTSLLTAMFGGSLWLSYKYQSISPQAGQLTYPLTLACGYNALIYYQMWCLNQENKMN